MKIDQLVNEGNVKLPVNKRYSAELVESYKSDLLRVLALQVKGQARPTYAALRSFFQQEYGIVVQDRTIERHLKKLSNGEEIWPVK